MLQCGTEMIQQLTCCLILDKRSLHYVVNLFKEVSVVQRCLLHISHDVKVDWELRLNLWDVWKNRVYSRYIAHVDHILDTLQQEVRHVVLAEENGLLLDAMFDPRAHDDTVEPVGLLEPNDGHVREVLLQLVHLVQDLLSLLQQEKIVLVTIRVHQVNHLVVDK